MPPARKRASPGEVATRIEAYLAAQPAPTRARLEQMRAAIRAVAPAAEESFSYGIPGFRLDGRVLVYYAGWRQHTSLYPITDAIRAAFAGALAALKTSKGTVRFPLDEKLPVTLLKRLVRARVAEVRA